MMQITIEADLELALKRSADGQGIAPEMLAVNALRERFLVDQQAQPRDQWERDLLEAATDCGVSLSHKNLSSEGLYE